MGSLNSKVSSSSANIQEQDNGMFLDPRSPTLHINRSPISQEGRATYASISKVKDLTSVLTEPAGDSLHTPNHLLPKRFQSIIDPRSPSTFTRTPLIVDPESVADCSLTNVVSSLQYGECSIVQPESDNLDGSYKDCDYELEVPDLNDLRIEYDDTEPIIEPQRDEKEHTIFEDAEMVPCAGIDPRSPSIAIARTPMVLRDDEDEEEETVQVAALLQASEGELKVKVEKQQRTPQQDNTPVVSRYPLDELTPKKEKLTPVSVRYGNRTPLGCMTNTGSATNNIRKMALIGQIKQCMVADEQKLLPRGGNTDSAELSISTKQSNRNSRIPKLRMS
uniref:Uncharacterized protein n=1 Tax=Anopheles farauti TaxID=69004 RepID=A0A182QV52_9DIPT